MIPSSARILEVAPASGRYEILIEPGLLDRAGEALAGFLEGRHTIIVTDRNVAATPHPGRVEASLARVGLSAAILAIEPGESAKAWRGIEALCERILALGIDRRTVILALGGGVIGDLAGFAAAILLRGLDVVQIPTTLLAQVDSSVGGKTGINSPQGKNLIGAFHQPRRVLIDPTVLADLPPRELRSGYAELVKHALIRDHGLFEWLEENGRACLEGEVGRMAEAIARSVAVKVAIVGQDEHEISGERALLNFGHTFAHAFETQAGYSSRLLHGEAVALGMAKAYALSVRLGLCAGQEAGRACAHLAAMGLPTSPSDLGLAFPPEATRAAMGKDKKVKGGRLVLVLTRGIGSALLCPGVPDDEIMAVLAADA